MYIEGQDKARAHTWITSMATKHKRKISSYVSLKMTSQHGIINNLHEFICIAWTEADFDLKPRGKRHGTGASKRHFRLNTEEGQAFAIVLFVPIININSTPWLVIPC